MHNSDVTARYQMFVDDYNAGLDRSRLCGKYKLADDRFDSFLDFLRRKGFVLDAPAFLTPLPHEIDFRIVGGDIQFVEIELDPGETAIADAGALMFMDSCIEMETIFGDGSPQTVGTMEKVFGAGKRILTGSSLFMTAFTNHGSKRSTVAFAAPYPGKIVPVDLGAMGGEIICQKSAFLSAAKGVSIDIAFQRKMGIGFFGGEGFIMQRLKGSGVAFLHAGGAVIERDIPAGETLNVDTGCLVGHTPGIDFDIRFVGGIRNALFGGEGLFFATVGGPGKVWLQSLPFSRIIDLVSGRKPAFVDGTVPQRLATSHDLANGKGSGSILENIGDNIGGGFGRMIGGAIGEIFKK